MATLIKKFASKPGRPPLCKVAEEMLTPKLKVIKSCIKTGHTFNNYTTRYYLITSCNPETGNEFLEKIETLREDLQCDIFLTEESKQVSTGAYESTGNYVIKFNSKSPPPIFSVDGTELELTKEFPIGTAISILFETWCYFDKSTSKYRLSFPIKRIIVLEAEGG